MPTKDSQKTEDMLDQTFANFDTEVTGAQTQDAPVGGGSAKANVGVKKSSNMTVFIGAGVAAVGAVAYLFVIKPMLQNAQAPVETVAQAPVTQSAPEAAQANPTVEVPATAPGVVPVDNTAQAQPETSVDPLTAQLQAAQQEQPVEAPVTTETTAQLNEQLAQAEVAPATITSPTPTPVVATPKTTPQSTVANTPANVQSVAVVDDLKSMFDKQTSEFRTVLTDMDTRVVALEGSVAEQKEINQKVDQRLGALEGMKKTVTPTAKVRKVKKYKVKKVASVEPKVDISKKEMDSAILVDNSGSTPKVKEKETETVSANLPKVNVHSIYGGRLWVKNGDGSLSTYTSGDKLPSGETIKAIDDEKFEITTNKRVIKS